MGSLFSKCKDGESEDFDDLNAPKPVPTSPAPVPAPDPNPPPRDPTPPPRDPTPPPRDPTPPPRDPTPPPRDPTPPPRDPTPPPRDPTPPPRDPTPPPPTDLPPSRDPTPPPTVFPPRDPSPPPTDIPVTPGLHFGTEYQPTHLDTFEVHVDFRSKPTKFDVDRRPFVSSGLYVDDEFPLHVALPKGDPNGRNLEWKRPTEIRDNPVLFSDGTSKYDIGQRSIGTCWFLAMVTNIADKPTLLRQVIPSDAYPVGRSTYDGVFHCRFWRYGVWEDVYIDDYLPIVYGTTVYGAHSDTDENEMWVALLEKAFARSYGSYEAVTGGQSAASFVALTSGVPEEVDLKSGEVTADELFVRMTNAHRSGAMVACAVPGEYNGHQGLIGNHEYTLTGTAVANGNHLFRVRNPWGGAREWTGAWSDESSEWSLVPEGAVPHANKDDGEFYISIEDFMQCFNLVTICSITPDFDRDGSEDTLKYVTCLYGDWRDDNAAGFRNKLQNPKYLIEVNENAADENGDVPLVVQIIQRTEHRRTDLIQIRCDVYKVFGSDGNMYIIDELGKKTNSYKNSPQRSFRYLVQPGKYIILPSAANAGDEKEFLVRTFTSGPLSQFKNLTHDSRVQYMHCDMDAMPASVSSKRLHSQVLMGNIREGVNAGGQVSYPTVGINPQFRITVNQTGFVQFQLLQDDKPEMVPLGIRMWRDDGNIHVPLTTPWINGNYRAEGTIVLMTDNDDGKFLAGPNVKADYVLDPGNYILLIHLNSPSDETKFALLAQSENKIDIR
ncbi:Calpain-B [Mizuhopecten yessoensis]|uniref:Calpain-B n=1 Tax=Mizuhopecten yessoensis TaxID=6573 RepID=A0A210R3B7_MIZYE|nr:Calpain-B [Mizuhopecten yessoensis]